VPDIELGPWLILFFFLIAFLYSMVGFGGGSSYIALLILMGVSHQLAPSIALICNIIVVAGGSFHFHRNGHLNWSFVAPFLTLSIPFSFLGGLIAIDKNTYQIILGLALFAAASRMLIFKRDLYPSDDLGNRPLLLLSSIIGAGLGFLSGLVGIGGGIFLAPILYIFKWGNPKHIAATASLFILVNSLAGLFGQLQKSQALDQIQSFTPLLLAVLVGGQLGSWFCNHKFSLRKIEMFTSLLIFVVSLRLLSNVL
jgi:uncharacterized protein